MTGVDLDEKVYGVLLAPAFAAKISGGNEESL